MLEAEVIAQCLARILLAVNATFLKFRDHIFYKILKTTRLMRWTNNKAVASTPFPLCKCRGSQMMLARARAALAKE